MTDVALALSEFLLARIAEDEAIAKSTSFHFGPHVAEWAVASGAAVTFNGLPHARIAQAAGSSPGQVAEHIARHDPARVLAECEAKRRIVEGIVPERDPYRDHPDYDAEWVLKDLASVYADHPDYRQEWKP